MRKFISIYKCPRCNQSWFDEFESICTDVCPECDLEDVYPAESKEVLNGSAYRDGES